MSRLEVYTADGELKVAEGGDHGGLTGLSDDDHPQYAQNDLKDSGISASTTPGTQICIVTATTGYKLVGVVIVAGHNAAANRALRVIVTYEDSSTTQFDTTGNTNTALFGNAGFLMTEDDTTPSVGGQELDLTQGITQVEIQTLGTAAGNRFGSVSASEVLI